MLHIKIWLPSKHPRTKTQSTIRERSFRSFIRARSAFLNVYQQSIKASIDAKSRIRVNQWSNKNWWAYKIVWGHLAKDPWANPSIVCELKRFSHLKKGYDVDDDDEVDTWVCVLLCKIYYEKKAATHRSHMHTTQPYINTYCTSEHTYSIQLGILIN